MPRDYCKIAAKYCCDVLSGKIPACTFVRQACQRQVDDLARKWEYRFDKARAAQVCRFIELLPHVKGSEWAGKLITLEPWQIFILTTVFGWIDKAEKRRYRICYTEVPRKNGKALALDTKIPTPDGFRFIRDIRPGDFVFAPNGKPTLVLAESEVYKDHDCYEMKFSTGESITCDSGHLWFTEARIDTPGRRGIGYKHGKDVTKRVRTTEEISKTLRFGKRQDTNHSTAIASAVTYSHKIYPIDPYVLGCWLGDGTSIYGSITVADMEIIEEIEKIEGKGRIRNKNKGKAVTYSPGRSFRNGQKKEDTLQGRLRTLGILGAKRLPEQYLLGSIPQRISLLQGLMDTDGSASKSGQLTFYSTNFDLATSTLQLVASLGLKPTFRSCKAKLNGRIISDFYHVSFFAYEDFPVFRLQRKSKRQKKKPINRTRSQTRQIVSCERVETVPCKCLCVDSEDHQFLVGSSYIPTHNSFLSAGVALYCLSADGEVGAEIVTAATKADQARIVLDMARIMVRKTPALQTKMGLEAREHVILRTQDASSFRALSKDHQGSQDGQNISCAIIDELHAHKTRDMWSSIDTATGARSQPLIWAITTAGSNRAGICYEQRDYVKKILGGDDDPRTFGIIYTADEGDLWDSESTWRKANPNYGVSVNPEDLKRKAAKAMRVASAQNEFLTKHLNIWVNASTAWMNMAAWDACAVPGLKLEDFEGRAVDIGLDLATKTDIAAKMYLFEDEGIYTVFGKYYLPEDTVEESENSQYRGWVRTGLLTTTDGPVIDFTVIEDDLREDASRFAVKNIAYDPWQATELATRMMAEGCPMIEYRPTVANFSEPMKQIEALVLEKKLRHNGDPLLAWAMSNVVAKMDAKGNIYPRKEFEGNKIDPVVGLIMPMGCAIKRAIVAPSWLETNGVIYTA